MYCLLVNCREADVVVSVAIQSNGCDLQSLQEPAHFVLPKSARGLGLCTFHKLNVFEFSSFDDSGIEISIKMEVLPRFISGRLCGWDSC